MSRHVRRLWALPGTALGVVGWPAVRRERLFLTWHYWWQAHLIDLAVDAAEREATPRRRRRVLRLTRSHRIRNLAGWTNNYFDDMAWLGLALERAQRHLYVDRRDAIAVLENELFAAWAPERGGGILAAPRRLLQHPGQRPGGPAARPHRKAAAGPGDGGLDPRDAATRRPA